MPKIPKSKWPDDLRKWNGIVQGVFVGGCVKRGDGSSFRAKAHAHCSPKDSHEGWICIRSAKRLDDVMLIRHELAHLISGEGHTDKFRKILIEIGGTLERTDSLKSYHKRTRNVCEVNL